MIVDAGAGAGRAGAASFGRTHHRAHHTSVADVLHDSLYLVLQAPGQRGKCSARMLKSRFARHAFASKSLHDTLYLYLQAPGAAGQAQRSLADIIMEKIRAQQAASGEAPSSE